MAFGFSFYEGWSWGCLLYEFIYLCSACQASSNSTPDETCRVVLQSHGQHAAYQQRSHDRHPQHITRPGSRAALLTTAALPRQFRRRRRRAGCPMRRIILLRRQTVGGTGAAGREEEARGAAGAVGGHADGLQGAGAADGVGAAAVRRCLEY